VAVVAPGPTIGCHSSAPSFAASPPAHQDTSPGSQSPTVTPATPNPYFTVQATAETSRTTAPRTERIPRQSSGPVPAQVSVAVAVTPPPSHGMATTPPPAAGAAVTRSGHADARRREANSTTVFSPTFSATGLRAQVRCSTSPGSKAAAAPEPRGSRSISPGREGGSLQRIASTGSLGCGADVASTSRVQRRASGGPWRSSVVRTMSSGSGGFDSGGGCPPKVLQSAHSARPILSGPQGTSQGCKVPCGTYSSSMIAMPPPSAQRQAQTQSRIMRASSTPLQTIRGCKGSGTQVATLAPNSSFSRRT